MGKAKILMFMGKNGYPQTRVHTQCGFSLQGQETVLTQLRCTLMIACSRSIFSEPGPPQGPGY